MTGPARLVPVVRVRRGDRPVEPAALGPRDRGFTLGDGLFETIRVEGGRPLRLERHLTRLREGAARLGIAVPDGLEGWIDEAVGAAVAGAGRHGAAPVGLGVLRISLSRGEAPGLVPPRERTDAQTVVVDVRPWSPDPRWSEEGVRVVPLPWPWAPGPLAGIKSLSWSAQVEAIRWARARGADEGLWRDAGGRWVEATTSNLFAVVDGVLRTPPLSSGCLPGVMRAVVLDEARAAGRPVDDGTPFEPDLLERADALFLTNSLRGRVPVAEVLGQRSPDPPADTSSATPR